VLININPSTLETHATFYVSDINSTVAPLFFVLTAGGIIALVATATAPDNIVGFSSIAFLVHGQECNAMFSMIATALVVNNARASHLVQIHDDCLSHG
jgi:hypothetical protein